MQAVSQVSRTTQRLVALAIALLLAVSGALALVAFTSNNRFASAAAPAPTTNPPLHQPTPITAADFPTKENDCGNGLHQDAFHFVLPGRDAVFTAFSATFRLPGGAVRTFTLGSSWRVKLVQSGKGVMVFVPAGSTLLSASATTSAPVRFFNLSHVCVGTPRTSPSPSPSPSSSTKSPTPSPSSSNPY